MPASTKDDHCSPSVEAHPLSKGELVFLRIDLADLSTIKASADEFLANESKLHVLFNNADVMFPPQGSKTAQGYELRLGTNNLSSFLFTKLLTPILIKTAKTEAPDTPPFYKYGVSKAGSYLHATEYARDHGKDGIVSVALHPGMLDSDLARNMSTIYKFILKWLFLYPAIYGAYTELFAGLSPDITIESVQKCDWIVPWGHFGPLRKDILSASKSESEGGTGLALKWWQWTEDQLKPYL